MSMRTCSFRLANYLRVSVPLSPTYSHVDVLKSSKLWHSTKSVGGEDEDEKSGKEVLESNDFLGKKEDLAPQGVDPRKGWGFRDVHKAIICGRAGQVPVKKKRRDGRFVTIFTVGTGGMFDQSIIGAHNLPRPAEWHRISVHHYKLGDYGVKKIAKNSPVYIEGDVETRVFLNLRNGRFVTIFTVGTGGMFDQRMNGADNLPRPAQLHRFSVHNHTLGDYAVKKINNSPAPVEGDIETRVFNDSINGEVRHIPEICISHDGKVHLIKPGEIINNISSEELREGLLPLRIN